MRRPSLVALTAAALAGAAGLRVGPTSPSRARSRPQRSERPGGGVALKRIGSFDEPVYVTGAPGFPQLLFVVEQPGRIVVLRERPQAGGSRSSTSAGRSATAASEGLLSVAFPPDYAQSKRFYVYYTDNARQHPRRRVQARAAPPGRCPARGAR